MRLNLSQKIPLLVVTAALVSGAVVAFADYRQAATELRRSAESNLTAHLDARRFALVDYLASLRRDLRMQADNPIVIEAFREFKKGWDDLGDDASARLTRLYIDENPYPATTRRELDRPDDSSFYSLAHERFHPRLREFVRQYGYRDLHLIDLWGNVLYSEMKQSDFAVNLENPAHANSGLATAYRRTVSGPQYGGETFVDFTLYGPAGGRPTGFVGRPLIDEFGTTIGVIALELPIDRINRVMNFGSGLGRTGEAFIAGPDMLMRSDSRFSAESTILRRKVDSGPVKAALDGRSGVMTSRRRGDDGVDGLCLSAYAPLDFLGSRWAIVAEMSVDEVNTPVRRIRNNAIVNGLLLALSVAVVGYLLTRTAVIAPLARVTSAVRRLSAGDRDSAIPSEKRGDEIGDIARALVLFRDNLVVAERDAVEFERQAKADEVRRRLAEAIEAIPDGFVLIDSRDTIVVVNSRYREIYAKSAHLLQPGRRFESFLRHQAALGEIAEAVGRVDDYVRDRMAQLRTSEQPITTRMADGTWLLTADSSTEDGGVVSVCSDISDLKRREHALLDSEERYRLLVDMLPNGVLLHDMQGIRFINSAGREFLEIPEGVPLENLHYLDFVHDSERDAAKLRIRDFINLKGDVPLTERRIRTFEGREIIIEIAAVPFRRGRTPLALAVFRDITDRKLTESRLRESESQVRAIVDVAADAIVMLDADDRIVDFNPSAEQIFGHRRDAVLGKKMATTLIASSHRATYRRRCRTADRKAPNTGDGSRGEIEAIRADASVFPAELTVTPVTVGGHRLFTAFLRDLTETRRAQEEIERQREALYQSDKLTALGSLLAGVAHELNNPLSVVVAQAMLMEETAEDERVVGRAKEIRSAADRCTRIVKTFLSMARQQTPQRGAVNLNRLVEDGLDLLAYSLRTAGVEVIRQLDAALPEIWGDSDQLHQVIANLVINAQQAMMDGQPPRRLVVTTTARSEDGMVGLTIDDSGPGVSAEMRSRIFEPFFTTKPTGVGTGIGLAICHGVVESHGGTIAVEDAPDGGARFAITLPSGDEKRAATAIAADRPGGNGAGGSVLVVDDEVEIASALAEILALDGLHVDVAESGRAALERIAGSDYDLILTDLRMPDMDGPGLYRLLEQQYPHLCDRMIMMSGDTLHAAASEFLQRTDLPMIEKPFDPADLLRLVEEILARPSPQAPANSPARAQTHSRRRESSL
ncbi:MAG: PAS domain S-box protein [Rhodospirillales bacterium]|nr:MAG: PAS domain S-box protein [Rhodospirillales bacterium]